jgi:hypothetical protein
MNSCFGGAELKPSLLDREDVIAIFDALADIKTWTHDMWSAIVGGDQSNEDEP